MQINKNPNKPLPIREIFTAAVQFCRYLLDSRVSIKSTQKNNLNKFR
jgi:hypothetical protein